MSLPPSVLDVELGLYIGAEPKFDLPSTWESCALADITSQKSGKYDALCSPAVNAKTVAPQAHRLLKPNRQLCLLLANDDAHSAVKRHCLFAGFVDIKVENDVLVCKKPGDTMSAQQPLNLGASGTIDDKDLLTDEDYKKPSQEQLKASACSDAADGTKPKKACKDCSCGLAEELAGEKAPPVKSSCGSCYLGDAFRCSTCPHRGTPAFLPGEQVTIQLTDDL